MKTDSILGNTPLVRLGEENINGKAEFLNPGGSVKDRVALAMLEGAERDGRLKPGNSGGIPDTMKERGLQEKYAWERIKTPSSLFPGDPRMLSMIRLIT